MILNWRLSVLIKMKFFSSITLKKFLLCPLINSNVRQYVESQEFSEFPFHEKNYGDVESAAGLNDTKSLVILAENCDDGEQSDIKDVVKEVADKVKNYLINVHWAFSNKGLRRQFEN